MTQDFQIIFLKKILTNDMHYNSEVTKSWPKYSQILSEHQYNVKYYEWQSKTHHENEKIEIVR